MEEATENVMFAFQLDKKLAEQIDTTARMEERSRSSLIRHRLRIALMGEETDRRAPRREEMTT